MNTQGIFDVTEFVIVCCDSDGFGEYRVGRLTRKLLLLVSLQITPGWWNR